LNKIKITDVFNIIKDILIKSCIYFTLIMIVFIIGGPIFAQGGIGFIDMLAFILSALFAGLAVQVYKIKKIPAISRHIMFFILLYIDFLFATVIFRMILMPWNDQILKSGSTLLLSACFIAIYLVIFGIVMGIKAIINSKKNKNLEYEKQFKNVK